MFNQNPIKMKKSIFILLSFFFIGACADPPVSDIPDDRVEITEVNNPEVVITPVECLVQTYYSQIGVRETGHNTSPEIDAYLASSGFGPGYAWCAAFVNWNHLQCDQDTPQGSAWSPSWFPNSRVVYSPSDNMVLDAPRRGDVFGIYYTHLNRIGHVGFVHDWGDRVTTVEGNTNDNGSRTGDGVYKKFRMARQIHSVARWVNHT